MRSAPLLKSVLARFHAFRHFLGVDKAVFYSVLLRVFSTAGGLVTIPLILTRLNPTEQGYYYTFGSILALQVFLEMGFGAVAVQMMAHEAAHLTIDLRTGVTGPQDNLDRFSATFQFIRKWYAALSILVGVLLLPAGFLFFSSSKQDASVHWMGPWVILVLSTAGDLFVRSLDSTIEGMGFVAESIRVNLWSAAIRIILSILGLLVGLRLYAVPVAAAIALVINRAMVWKLLHVVSRGTLKHGQGIRIDWKRDVFPFQWRIALSWVSGWFIFSAMMPVVFREFGPIEAGRFGLAMSLSGFINTFAVNWTSTKAAIWGQMASRKEWKAMDDLFKRVTLQAVGMALLGSILAVILVPHLGEWIPRFAGRVPDWRVLALLCIATVMNQVVFAEAFYLRAHKREPFLVISVIAAIVMSLGVWLYPHKSVFSITIMYAVLTMVGGLIPGSLIFIYLRSRWHESYVRELTSGFYKRGSK
jgi:hypothetical protein